MKNTAAAVEVVDAPPGNLVVGRDEMNLAEFPLTLLADRAPGDLKTLCYVNRPGTLVVTGSDAFGLPLATDADVIIGLIQLTRLRNNFADPKVPFTRYELLRVLGWPDESRYYRRLDESLNRWVGVTLHYQNSWWDNRAKRYLSAKMHILESVILDERAVRRGKGSTPVSSFTWNQTFIESCQADNLKRLDLDTYFSLRSAVTKRMYRFLDKRFYLRPDWAFELKEFAFEYVGLSRGYEGNAGKVKEKLRPAVEELESIGFLAPLDRGERYSRSGPAWTIRLVQHPSRASIPTPTPLAAALAASASAAPEPVEQPPQLAALRDRGVTEATARQILEHHPAERIDAKIVAFDWLAARDDPRIRKSPAGYLVESIRKDYAPPRGFRPDASAPVAPAPSTPPGHARAVEARRQARIDAYLSNLSDADRERLTDEAVAEAAPYYRSRYQRLRESDPPRAEKCLRAILESFLTDRLPDPDADADSTADPGGDARCIGPLFGG